MNIVKKTQAEEAVGEFIDKAFTDFAKANFEGIIIAMIFRLFNAKSSPQDYHMQNKKICIDFRKKVLTINNFYATLLGR